MRILPNQASRSLQKLPGIKFGWWMEINEIPIKEFGKSGEVECFPTSTIIIKHILPVCIGKIGKKKRLIKGLARRIGASRS